MDDDYRKYGTSRAAHMLDNEDPHKCFVCGAAVPDGAIECPKCGFPQNGDEASQRLFLGDLRAEKKYTAFAAFRVNHAFSLLLFMPLNIFYRSYLCWAAGKLFQAEVYSLFAIAFFITWYFGRKNPFRAFAISIALYTGLVYPAIISEPWFALISNVSFIWPYIFLFIGLVNFIGWQEMSEDLAGKNSG